MSNIGWNQVSANFNDSNQAMANAQRGFSQVGTVFGELRKSILDEEQRAVENAFKEKQLAENVRQFGIKSDIDLKQLGETSRHNSATELLTAMGHLIQREANAARAAEAKADARYRNAMLENAAERLKLDKEKDARENEQIMIDKDASKVHASYSLATPEQKAAQQKALQDVLNNPNATSEEKWRAGQILPWMQSVDLTNKTQTTDNLELSDLQSQRSLAMLRQRLGSIKATKDLADIESNLTALNKTLQDNQAKNQATSVNNFDKFLQTTNYDNTTQVTLRDDINHFSKLSSDINREAVAKQLVAMAGGTQWYGGRFSPFGYSVDNSNLQITQKSNAAKEVVILQGLLSGALTESGKPLTGKTREAVVKRINDLVDKNPDVNFNSPTESTGLIESFAKGASMVDGSASDILENIRKERQAKNAKKEQEYRERQYEDAVKGKLRDIRIPVANGLLNPVNPNSANVIDAQQFLNSLIYNQ